MYTYDGAGRPATVTAADSAVTTYHYDTNGNQLDRVDPNLATTTYQYDAVGRMTRTVDPAGHASTVEYDAAGRVAKTVDPNGNASGNTTKGGVTYTYDRRGLLTATNYGDGATPNVTYSFDKAGRRIGMTDGIGEQTYTYDPADQLTEVSRGGSTFNYVYDRAGNVVERRYPNGTTITSTVDAVGRPTAVSSGSAGLSASYDPAGRLSGLTQPGTTETFTYDRVGRQTGWNTTGPAGAVIARDDRVFDDVGNPVSQTTQSGSSTYSYDSVDRVTGQTLTPTSGTAVVSTYGYDRSGNRIQSQPLGGTPSSTVFNNVNQPVGAGLTFDADGQLTSDGVFNYSWNQAHRMVSATQIAPKPGVTSAPAAVMADTPLAFWRMGTKNPDGSWPNSVAGGPAMVAPVPTAPAGVPAPGGPVVGNGAQSMSIDNPNDVLQVTSDDSGLALTSGAFTVEWWQKTTATTGRSFYYTAGTGKAYWNILESTSGVITFTTSGGTFSTPTAVPRGGWRHLAVVSDGTTWKWVVDGTVVASRAAFAATLTNTVGGALRIGGSGDGQMSEVAVFDHAVPLSRLGSRSTGSQWTYASEVLGDQPWGYWPLGEPTGAITLTDWSGHGHVLGANKWQTPWSTDGAVVPDDGAVSFDGYNDRTLTATAVSAFSLNGPQTIEFWVRPTGPAQTSEMLVSSAASGGWRVSRSPDNSVTYWRGNVTYASPAGLVASEGWTHVAVTFDGTYFRFYRNGELFGAPVHIPGSSLPSVPVGQVGLGSDGGLAPAASIDEVAIFATAIPGGHYQAPPVRATYSYDGNGDRITETVNGRTTSYTIDPNNRLAEVATETTPDGTNTYLYGPAGLAAINTAGVWTYIHNNQLGSTAAVTTTTGETVATRTYSAYGDTTADTGTMPNTAQRFAGGTRDPETGLYYLRARYLNTATGTFLSQDPIDSPTGTAYEDPYTYTHGRPTTMVDPSGLLPEGEGCVSGPARPLGGANCPEPAGDAGERDPFLEAVMSLQSDPPSGPSDLMMVAKRLQSKLDSVQITIAGVCVSGTFAIATEGISASGCILGSNDPRDGTGFVGTVALDSSWSLHGKVFGADMGVAGGIFLSDAPYIEALRGDTSCGEIDIILSFTLCGWSPPNTVNTTYHSIFIGVGPGVGGALTKPDTYIAQYGGFESQALAAMAGGAGICDIATGSVLRSKFGC